MRPVLLAFLLACQPTSEPRRDRAPDGPLQPLDDQPWTTLQATWVPNIPSEATADAIARGELLVTDLDRFDDAGLGVHMEGGIPWIERTELGPGFTEGADRRSVLYLWQVADPQIIDEESPVRFEGWNGIYRPNGHLTVQSFEAHVATARRISEVSGRPFDFAVVAGDLTDGSGYNELEWFFTGINGGVIDPDSGVDDDPIPNVDDFNDPLSALGIGVPWYAAIGNHETLYIGGFGSVTDELRDAARGSEVYQYPAFPNGFRDGSLPGAPVVTEGRTPPDDARLVLNRHEVLSMLQAAGGEPAGHGLTVDDVEAGRGWYSVHPVPNRPIRLVVLDTVHTNGLPGEASWGFVSLEQLEWLQSTLAEADAAHELILVMSHHRLQDIGPTSEASEDDLAAALAASEGVFLLVTGHGHANTEGIFPSDWSGADPTLGFWQLMLASTLDFPMHSRVIEVVDEGNGYLTVYCTNLDHNSPKGSLPHTARAQAAAKWAFPGIVDEPDVEGSWAGQADSMNYQIRLKIPESVADELGGYDWPTRIESEQTLADFTRPAAPE